MLPQLDNLLFAYTVYETLLIVRLRNHLCATTERIGTTSLDHVLMGKYLILSLSSSDCLLSFLRNDYSSPSGTNSLYAGFSDHSRLQKIRHTNHTCKVKGKEASDR